MKLLAVLLCVGLVSATPPLRRTKAEIEELRRYLESSRIDDGVLLESRMLENPHSSVWESSGRYQGDIVLDPSQIEALVEEYATGGASVGNNRNAYIVANTRWPGNQLIYIFGANEFNTAQTNAILNAMSWVEHFSCVRFRRRTNERTFVTIRGQGTGCYAHVGFSTQWPNRVNNLARNTVGRGCFTHSVIIHELLHSIGFQHMHQTLTRHNYIRVNWNNIIQNYQFAFEQFNSNRVSLHGLPYEYHSIMHYFATAFSRNGQPTMTALRSTGNRPMGSLAQATQTDWLRLRRHYNCPGAWSANAADIMKEEVERMTPLINMNLPAPKQKYYTEDDAYVESLSHQLEINSKPLSEEANAGDFDNVEVVDGDNDY